MHACVHTHNKTARTGVEAVSAEISEEVQSFRLCVAAIPGWRVGWMASYCRSAMAKLLELSVMTSSQARHTGHRFAPCYGCYREEKRRGARPDHTRVMSVSVSRLLPTCLRPFAWLPQNSVSDVPLTHIYFQQSGV